MLLISQGMFYCAYKIIPLLSRKQPLLEKKKKQFLPGQWHSDKIAQTFFLLAMVLKADLELIIL